MKIGIAGAGSIVPVFLETQEKVDAVNIVAISGMKNDIEVMEELCATYQIDRMYDSYSEMLKDDNVEAVYIAVPNSLHYSFTKEALKAGKHVICEKPFCSNSNQVQDLIEFASKNKLFLHEAVSPENFPCFHKMTEFLPKLGDVKIVELNYSQYSRRYDALKQGVILPAFDPKLSGGALMDLNVYNIHFIVGLFGQPEKISYFANIEKNIDTSGILILEYPSFKCVSIAAKDCKAPVCVNIQGDKGFIHGDWPPHVVQKITLGMNNGDELFYEGEDIQNRLYYELKYFSDIVKNNRLEENRRMLEHSLNVQKILDEARRQAGIEIQQ